MRSSYDAVAPQSDPSPPAPKRRAQTAVVRLGLACPLNCGEGRRLLSRLHAGHPRVALSLTDGDELELAEALEHDRLDAIIAPDAAARRRWRSIPLWTEPLMLVLREGHPLAANGAPAASAVRGEPLILAGNGDGDRAFRRAVFDALGGRPAEVTHHAVQRDTLLDLVALGLGVTVTPAGLLGAYYPGVTARPLRDERAQITFSLMWRSERGEAAARWLLEGLTAKGR